MSMKIETLQRIDLGIMGEDNARVVLIDCAGWVQQFPNGSISIYHKRHGDNAMGVTGATFDRETGILSWPVTDYDTYYDGDGLAEIRLTDRTVIKKKKRVLTLVRPAVVNENGDAIDSNWQAYIDEVERLKALLASEAEAWAKGTRNGEPVDSDDDTYHMNSKYFADTIAGLVDDYIAAINAAGEAAEALIPDDLTFYASVASVTNRLAAFARVEGTTLILGEPEEEET